MKIIIIILGLIGIGVWFDQSSLWVRYSTYMKDGNLIIYGNMNWPVFIGGFIVIIVLTIVLYKIFSKKAKQ